VSHSHVTSEFGGAFLVRLSVVLILLSASCILAGSASAEIHSVLAPVQSGPSGATPSPHTNNPPDIPPHGILFSGTRNGNTDVFYIRPDGTGLTRLTDHWEDDEMPVWSPDGEWIVFKSRRHGNWDIFRMRRNGTEQTRLTDNPASDESPSWSRDGSMIVFSSDRNGESQIFRMNHDGTNQQELTHRGMHSDVVPHVSPADDLVAYATRSTLFPNWQIHVIPIVGGESKKLSPAGGCRAKWSADGSKLAYVSAGLIERSDIWVFNADGTGLRRITKTDEFDYDPFFSPDGARLCFARGRSEKSGWDLYIVNLDGSGLRALTSDGAGDRFPCWR